MNTQLTNLKILAEEYNHTHPQTPIDLNTDDVDSLIVQLWMRNIDVRPWGYGEPFDSSLEGWAFNGLYDDERQMVVDDHGQQLPNLNINTNRLYLKLKYWKEAKQCLFYRCDDMHRPYTALNQNAAQLALSLLSGLLEDLNRQMVSSIKELRRQIPTLNKLEAVYLLVEIENHLITDVGFDSIVVFHEDILKRMRQALRKVSNIVRNRSARNIQRCWKSYWMKPFDHPDYDHPVSRYMIHHFRVSPLAGVTCGG